MCQTLIQCVHIYDKYKLGKAKLTLLSGCKSMLTVAWCHNFVKEFQVFSRESFYNILTKGEDTLSDQRSATSDFSRPRFDFFVARHDTFSDFNV